MPTLQKREIYIRSLVWLLISMMPGGVAAQTFTTLDWANPAPIYEGESLIDSDLPGFAEAYHFEGSHLPWYVTQEDLGRDYNRYSYAVKVEYPEFEAVAPKEARALKASGIKLPEHPQVETRISVSAKRGELDARFIPLVLKDGKYLRIRSFKLSVEKRLLSQGGLLPAGGNKPAERYADNSLLASGRWVKIRLEETGVYKISHDELRDMGFSDPSKVRLYGYGGFILPEDLRIPKIDDLQEVPLWREEGYVLFHARGTIKWQRELANYVHTQNHYSTHSYYFLTEGKELPKDFDRVEPKPDAKAQEITSFMDYALEEQEAYSWYESGKKLYGEYDYKQGDTKTYTFSLPGITNDTGVIGVAFSVNHDEATSATVWVDDLLLGNVTVDKRGPYDKGNDGSRGFVWPGNKRETTVIRLKHNRPDGVSGRLDYIRLTYKRRLALYGDYTAFRPDNAGTYRYMVDNATPDVRVWDVGSPTNHKLMASLYEEGKCTFVGDSSEYVVVNPKGVFKCVEVVGEVSNQNLHALNNLDMVIIVPPVEGLMVQAERLAEVHRQKDGLRVQLVTSEQIYNEFSSGTPDATAYRWFMKMLYDRAPGEQEQPKYLLLFGDGTYDNRMLTSSWRRYNPLDFLLCFESPNSVSQVNSYVIDDYYGYLDDEEGLDPRSSKVDIGIGRLPLRTPEQAEKVVDKLIDYMNNKHAGAWRNTICFLGDDGTQSEGENPSGANVHMRQSNELAKMVESANPDFIVQRIFWDAYKREKSATGNSYPGVRRQILDNFDNGMLVMNYTGHGSPVSFSHEYCLIISDIEKMHSPKAPLWFTAACEVTPFDAIDESMGELALLNPYGAAIALYTTVRTVYPAQNYLMNTIFLQHLFKLENDGNYPRLGDVVRRTKAEITGKLPSVNNLHYVFLGDPAMRLVSNDYKVVVDEFNGKTPSETASAVKAGGIVEVKGRVVDKAGVQDTGFNGMLYSTIFDTRVEITTFNNSGYSDVPFVFETRDKTLFSGSNPIVGGAFSFVFPVPLDINYANESGLLNFYAIENTNGREGRGFFDNFLIGGTEKGALDTDSVGPGIMLYLNDPAFVNGGKTDEAPQLIAYLEDEDGINTSGNGIGHDIVAIIDNSPVRTYILNNYYQPDMGDYKKGYVHFNLPQLPDGKHQLMFRAWDMKNNSSSVTLDFEVELGYDPSGIEVECLKTPTDDETEFVIYHHQPGSELAIRLSVYDLSGKLLWLHTEHVTPSADYYQVPWNLRMNDGTRLSQGMYMYHASVSSRGKQEQTKAKKIVVFAQ